MEQYNGAENQQMYGNQPMYGSQQMNGNQPMYGYEKKNNNVFGIVSLIFSIIPVILFIYCYCQIVSSGSSVGGAIGWLLVIYYWTFGIPIFICSIVFGILGLIKGNKVIPIISLVINGLKIVMLLCMLFGGNIFRIF